MSADEMLDLFVIGGGINGCGIARDAAGRGYSVMLAEMQDLAAGTSSASTKLVHGGLRYLEYREFRLVREALTERERLWAMAPHIIRPMRFVLPHHSGLRPRWMLRFGLFLYDHLGGRKRLPATRSLDLRQAATGAPLKPEFTRGFEYSDCWVDDARLVVLNAMDARARGAEIRTRTRVRSAIRVDGAWQVTMVDLATGTEQTVRSRILINAGGPWVDRVLGQVTGQNDAHHVRLVQGSHIVVPRIFDHDRSYIFQNADGRIIFAIPYEGQFTLIGTTDRDYDGDPKDARISDQEIDYLCAAASTYFTAPVTRDSVVWTYAGVRPLYDDGASAAQEATRDYVLTVEKGDAGPDGGTAPLVNIFGGKITTYRRLSEEVLERIDRLADRETRSWTGTSHLPGGDFGLDDIDRVRADLQAGAPWADPALIARLFRLYGTRTTEIIGSAKGMADLGRDFGAGLTESEVRYLCTSEWATGAEDILWRRTKMGLMLTPAQRADLDAFLAAETR